MGYKRAFAVFLFFSLFCCAFAADVGELGKKVNSPEAKKAILTYEQAVSRAKRDFEKEVATARKKLAEELEAAQTTATKANQLDEAVAIRNVKNALRESREPVPPGRTHQSPPQLLGGP